MADGSLLARQQAGALAVWALPMLPSPTPPPAWHRGSPPVPPPPALRAACHARLAAAWWSCVVYSTPHQDATGRIISFALADPGECAAHVQRGGLPKERGVARRCVCGGGRSSCTACSLLQCTTCCSPLNTELAPLSPEQRGESAPAITSFMLLYLRQGAAAACRHVMVTQQTQPERQRSHLSIFLNCRQQHPCLPPLASQASRHASSCRDKAVAFPPRRHTMGQCESVTVTDAAYKCAHVLVRPCCVVLQLRQCARAPRALLDAPLT